MLPKVLVEVSSLYHCSFGLLPTCPFAYIHPVDAASVHPLPNYDQALVGREGRGGRGEGSGGGRHGIPELLQQYIRETSRRNVSNSRGKSSRSNSDFNFSRCFFFVLSEGDLEYGCFF